MTPCKKQAAPSGKQGGETFRIALGLGQGIAENLSRGIVYQIGDQTAATMTRLQQMYIDTGSTEMYVRIATKRYHDGGYGEDSEHGTIHNLEVGLEYCRVAASLNHPINPEIMCAYTYMDVSVQQAPNFKEYPEIIQPDKDWSEYTLSEMCGVLEQYGELVAREVLATGCTVEYWNLGNEANLGFAGVNLGLKTAVSPVLEHVNMERIEMEQMDTDFLKENLWKYNGQMMAALAKGIRKAHADAKFASHIAGLFNAHDCVIYFNTLLENGMELDQAGISIYPTNNLVERMPDYMDKLKSAIKAVVSECGLPVFMAEYGYPSEVMGGFGWNSPIDDYKLTVADQARFTADFIAWCKENGGSGIRPWAPDLLGAWEPMSLFSYDEERKLATAKPVMEVFMKESPVTSGKQSGETFRIALGLGQDIDFALTRGIVYQIGDRTATTMTRLQQMYIDAGSTEMFVRIATKRYSGDDSYHARLHNLEECLKYCRVAASLNHPINPEIMCAYTYMDASVQQAPDFREYPEITQPDKEWSKYTLLEMCGVLEQYGEFIAGEVLKTGCTVEYWNLGNEANFGFAGVNLGLKTAVNPKLEHADMELVEMEHIDMDHIDVDFLKENVWKYNGQMMAALAKGIRKIHADAKFATHIAGLFDGSASAAYFNTLLENGMKLSQAGISIYPTMSLAKRFPDYVDRLKSAIKAVASECGLPVFIAEYGYPSKKMRGFAWNQPVEGYELTAADQARFTADFIAWCKENGGSGIRPWAPDLLGPWEPNWESMSLFAYDDTTKIAMAKPVMDVFIF